MLGAVAQKLVALEQMLVGVEQKLVGVEQKLVVTAQMLVVTARILVVTAQMLAGKVRGLGAFWDILSFRLSRWHECTNFQVSYIGCANFMRD